MIQLTKEGVSCSADVSRLAREFEQTHTIRLPQLLHPELMRLVWTGIARGPWIPYEHEKIGRELSLRNAAALAALNLAADTPSFLRIVEEITGCRHVCRFAGRIYRMLPGTDHYDSWHDDADDDRLVGMSITLGPRPCVGGVFQLREKSSTQILCRMPNPVPGDAILFRISRELAHMVTAVEGDEPKTAFAGWFMSSGTNLLTTILATHSLPR